MGVEVKPEAPVIRPPGRRAHPRYAVESDSVVLLIDHGHSLNCTIVDLSLEGCRIRTRERISVGTMARVEIAFKVNGIAFRFNGVTQWTNGRNLAGIRFVDVIPRRREALAEVLSEFEAAMAAKAQKEAAEKAAAGDTAADKAAAGDAAADKATTEREKAEKAAQEKAEKAERELAGQEAQDLAVRQAQEQAEKLAAAEAIAGQASVAPPAGASARSGPAPVRRNRRAQIRHEVDAWASIYLVKAGSRLDGRLLDLSVGGCLIRTVNPFPLGIYTRVETGFYLNGLSFRLGGVIQAVYDRHHVGIRFVDVSDRNRLRVEELIEEIREMERRAELAEPGADESKGPSASQP